MTSSLKVIGKALEAYTAMDEDNSCYFSDLREVLLAKFEISAELLQQLLQPLFTNLFTPANQTAKMGGSINAFGKDILYQGETREQEVRGAK